MPTTVAVSRKTAAAAMATIGQPVTEPSRAATVVMGPLSPGMLWRTCVPAPAFP